MIRHWRFVLLFVAIIGALGMTVWFAFNVHAKRKYDEVRADLGRPYTVTEMDEDTASLYDELHANWELTHSQIDGPHSDALKTVGLTPSVSNVIALYTYELPEYSWLSPARNEAAMQFAMVYAVILPATTDQSIHVSADRHSAIVYITPNLVDVFTDDADGLRESTYRRLRDNQTSPQPPE